MANSDNRRRLTTAGLVLGAFLFVPAVPAAPNAGAPVKYEALRRLAESYERDAQWVRACEVYAELLAKDRSLPEVRERYAVRLRHVHQVRRHRDKTFREQVLSRDVDAALKVYGEVLVKLKAGFVDRELVSIQRLFLQGLDEFRQALADEVFRQEHLAGVGPDVVDAFAAGLDDFRKKRPFRRARDAQDLALDVALAAQKALGLRPTVTVLEFTCGACNGLDEYTFYLTPGQLSELFDSLDGDLAGVGIEPRSADGRLTVAQVARSSPAALAGVKRGDRLVRIDHKPAAGLSAAAAAELLRGEPGSVVELVVLSPGRAEPHLVSLTRRAARVTSVMDVKLRDPEAGVGYIRLSGFHKTTPEDLDAALLDLKMQGMRALVLDLRDNPGGLFLAAVQVAERFLASGVIASTQGRLGEYNRTYEAGNPNALTVPLVVLIDGETASAAEVLAGALKENRRATLVGGTTFGKGCIQCVLQLDAAPAGGVRITLAKFYSPQGRPYSGTGVTPHLPVERTSMGLDEQWQAALQAARELLMMPR